MVMANTTITTSNLCAAQFEYAAILFLRSPWLARLWGALLAASNILGVVLFRQPPASSGEVWVILLTFAACHFFMGHLYQYRGGFTKLLGLAHAPWLVLVPWLVVRVLNNNNNNHMDDNQEPTNQGGAPGLFVVTLKTWLWIVIALDSIALVVDAWNVVQYFQGDTEPIYSWRRESAGYETVDEAVAVADAADRPGGEHSESSQYSTYSV